MTSEFFFESILEHFHKNLPFVAYRKPNESEVKAICQTNNSLHKTSDFTESGFVFAPFDATEDAILIPINDSELLHVDYITTRIVETTQIEDITTSKVKTEHINLVQKGIDAINLNEFKKVVLSRQETIKIEKTNPIEIFKRLLNTYKTAFVYCWYHPKIGLWLGATPETLLNLEGNRLSTMALAGTQKYEDTLNVIWKDKEREEQQIVTDFIVNGLQSSVANLNVSEVETIKSGNLLHLKTVISGTFNFQLSNFKQLLSNLHPTPAVCGLPKEAAKQFIHKHENYNREFYTGFLGELNVKERKTRNTNRHNVENDAYATIKTVSNLYVNLRCMQIKEQNALIYIGGGITKDSNPEAEWEETVHKSLVMKKVLQ